MDTIPELPNDDLNNNTNHNNNNDQKSHVLVDSSNSSSSVASVTEATAPSKIHVLSPTSSEEELKIIGHLRSIERIGEKRRLFLANTLSETSVDGVILNRHSHNNSSCSSGSAAEVNGTTDHHDQQSASDVSSTAAKPKKPATLPLQSPLTPPPKPPMLSRTRSIGVGDDRVPRTPLECPPIVVTTTPTPKPTPTTTPTPTAPERSSVAATLSTEAVKTEADESPVLLRIERPVSTTAVSNSSIMISENHYERLIEELKCPGCASPMKAPILLCQTGHSICEQCTRVLLTCPLCKEPFSTMRSLTLEALCSKAHFRCSNASGGCVVRLQYDLLSWHEKQCIFKPMKCFMGRVWGNCEWNGREAYWKEHLETEHADRVFTKDNIDLVWNMAVKQRPLSGYYVFEVCGEMFNFYQVYDKDRVLFTMTCTSTIKEKKQKYAFEVTVHQPDNEALSVTQKYPMHSEYDSDILLEGTCANFALTDLVKFLDEEKILYYRVRILEINATRKCRSSKKTSSSNGPHPANFQQTQIEGVNLKSVPCDVIVTRREDTPYTNSASEHYADSGSESDPEFEAFIAKKWGTPQMNFNRKFLAKPPNSANSSNEDGVASLNKSSLPRRAQGGDDKTTVSSTPTNYKQKVANTLRKSFRSIRTDLINTRQFLRKTPEKRQEH